MARKRSLFFHRLSAILKYLCLGLSLMLLLILCNQKAQSQTTLNSKRSDAQILTEKGYEQLHQGQAEAALQTWEFAYHAYKQLNDSDGMTGSLINQSLAFQARGFYPRACQALTQALELENWLCTSSIQERQYSFKESQERLSRMLQKQAIRKVRVIGLRNLGDVLRILGSPEASSVVLKKASAIGESLALESNFNNQLLLSQANTERTLYSQAKNRYQMTDDPGAKQEALVTAKAKIKSAIEFYQKVQGVSALQAQLNQLSLLLEIEKWTALTNTDISNRRQLLQDLVKQLSTTPHQFDQLPAIESIYARLNLAQILIQIAPDEKLKRLLFTNGENSLKAALSIAQKARLLAQELNNERAESYASGTIGNIYNSLGQEFESKKYLEQAMGLAQSIQAWDIAYQWQWNLGHLYQVNHNIDKAVEYYRAAISSLDQVRGSILAVNTVIQWEFKEKVEPVYQEYMELILSQDKPNLKQAVKIQEKLKLAELETFLQCGKLPAISLRNDNKLNKLPPTIYLIKLKNIVKVIVRTPQGRFYQHSLDARLLINSIDSLITGVQNKEFTGIQQSNLLVYSQAIYDLLFAPIKQYLPHSGTLIFVLDTYFQNFPVSMLHDGKNYLIDSYNIATSSSSDFWQSPALKSNNLIALIAGIFKESPSLKNPLVPKNFQVLPEVETEIANIKGSTTSALVLANAEFTSDRFQQEIENNLLTVVHLSTHGQFSSDPEKTFVLAWDVPVDVRELRFLLKTERSGIDLLVLSACQTAKGDRRSALGIAGIAAQAGARSTVASLWLVEAESTALLMEEFYKGLKNGMTKAEALRLAQLKLMSNPKYENPYFWSGFILVGNWL
jgi:CHAT domain-containing protein